jgi:hypothetical protein
VHEQFQYHDFLSDEVVFTQEHEEFVLPVVQDACCYVEFPVVLVVVNTVLATQQ